VRSFRDAEMERVLNEIKDNAARFGASCEVRDGYPGWEPRGDSELLERAREAFIHTQGGEPLVQVVHAGLECGLLVRKKPDLAAISFGPHIRGAHTPEECAQISSVAASWSLLAWLLDDLSK
jgi:dipeptidase D